MTRISLQNYPYASESFDPNTKASEVTYDLEEVTSKDLNESPFINAIKPKKIIPQISGVLWESTLRRHCDSRQTIRSLLDRYIKPHH